MPYFVIHSSEDGISIDQMTAAQVIERITPADGNRIDGFLDHVPAIDKGCFYEQGADDKLLIIEGRIVVPRVKTVVQEYEL